MTDVEEKSFYVERGYSRADWEGSMCVAWDTFLRFDADDYSQEGILNFNEFVTDPILYQMYRNGEYVLFTAKDRGTIIGMITLRNETHISLLFVSSDYQKRGVGRALMAALCHYLRWDKGEDHVTVNAAPYGIGFYHKLGFTDTGEEQSADGIRFTPMIRKLV